LLKNSKKIGGEKLNEAVLKLLRSCYEGLYCIFTLCQLELKDFIVITSPSEGASNFVFL